MLIKNPPTKTKANPQHHQSGALDTSTPRRVFEELALGFSLMTRLPLPRFDIKTSADLASSFWAYPLAGAVCGAAGAAGLLLATALQLGAMMSAFLAIAFAIMASGALHEDGLADVCDGIGGGQTKAQKLEIMKDSRLGTYGALGLVLMIGAEVALLVEIITRAGPLSAALVMIAAAAAARFMIVLPLAGLDPAREEGFSVAAAAPSGMRIVAGFVIAAVIAIGVLGPAGIFAMVGAALGAIFPIAIAYRFLQGYTGDVLGATAKFANLGALILVVAVTAP